MSPEERQMLTGLFDRIQRAAATPRDPEAAALISDAVRNMPYAPYLLAQAVIVQDHALQAANDKLQEQEGRLRDLEHQIGQQQPAQATSAGGFLGGLGSIFGAGSSRPPEPPPASVPASGPWGQQAPQPPRPPYAPPPLPPSGNPWSGAPGMGPEMSSPGMGSPGMGNPGMGYPGTGAPMGGGGFLHGALGAAAGVAGGVLLADSIRGLFGAHNNPLGIGSGLGGLGGALGGSTGLGGGTGLGGLGSALGTGANANSATLAPTADKIQTQAQPDSEQDATQQDDAQDASYDDNDNDSDNSDDSDDGDDGSYDV